MVSSEDGYFKRIISNAWSLPLTQRKIEAVKIMQRRMGFIWRDGEVGVGRMFLLMNLLQVSRIGELRSWRMKGLKCLLCVSCSSHPESSQIYWRVLMVQSGHRALSLVKSFRNPLPLETFLELNFLVRCLMG